MKFQWICKLEGGHVPTCPLPGDATANYPICLIQIAVIISV